METKISLLMKNKHLDSKFYEELTTLNSNPDLIITKEGVYKLLNSLRKYVQSDNFKRFDNIRKEEIFGNHTKFIIREIECFNILGDPKHKYHYIIKKHLCPNCKNILIETGMAALHDSSRCSSYRYCLNCKKSYRCFRYGDKKEEIEDINFISCRE